MKKETKVTIDLINNKSIRGKMIDSDKVMIKVKHDRNAKTVDIPYTSIIAIWYE